MYNGYIFYEMIMYISHLFLHIYICIFINIVLINVANVPDITFSSQNKDISFDISPTELNNQGILKVINAK